MHIPPWNVCLNEEMVVVWALLKTARRLRSLPFDSEEARGL